MPPLTRKAIVAAAVALRNRLGLSDQARIDIVNILEFQLPKLIPKFNFVVTEDEKFHPGILALTRGNPPEIVVSESVYQGALRQDPRSRMVLAHEIGHLALGHAGIRGRRDSRSNPFCKSVAMAEHQANQFAAEFLLPSHLAAECKTVSEIAERFGVSRAAAEIRKRELDRTSNSVGKRPLPQSLIEFLRQGKKKRA